MSVARRDPPPQKLEEAIRFLEGEGFKLSAHRFGPKQRFDVGWPDERRGIRLPEWRIVQIAAEWRKEKENA